MSGLDDEASPIAFLKDALTAERVAGRISPRRGHKGSAVHQAGDDSGRARARYFVVVPALYWGVQRLLRAVLTDEQQLPGAEQLAHVHVRFLSR